MHAIANSSNPDTPVSMTSVELVDYINSERAEGESKLEHSDFLKKVPQVLGKDAGNFSSIYFDSMNRQKPCYTFPKREACLMAMSYSYDLQAKVFDRMTALEQRTAPAPVLTRLDILKLAMESEEGRIKAEAERDHAVATKALIGSKREATAMATAAVATKEVLKLKDSMGEATRRAAVIAVERASKVKTNTYDWRVLRNYCLANELDFGKVWNPGLQMEVNSYPAEAWMRCHGVDLVALFGKKAA